MNESNIGVLLEYTEMSRRDVLELWREIRIKRSLK
jgi:hypothetical protein